MGTISLENGLVMRWWTLHTSAVKNQLIRYLEYNAGLLWAQFLLHVKCLFWCGHKDSIVHCISPARPCSNTCCSKSQDSKLRFYKRFWKFLGHPGAIIISFLHSLPSSHWKYSSKSLYCPLLWEWKVTQHSLKFMDLAFQ